MLAALGSAVALLLLGSAPGALADPVSDAATLDTTTTRTLTIHKYEGPTNTAAECAPTGQPVPDTCLTGKTALAGAEFTIWRVLPLNTNAEWAAAAAQYSAGAPTTPPAGSTLVGTYTTLADGSVTIPFGTDNALYYVQETKAPPGAAGVTYTGAVPFFVTVPMTMPNDTTWDYTVDVYPKNNKFENPHKSVTDQPTQNVGGPISYRVAVTIPAYSDVVGAPSGGVSTAADGTVNGYDVGSYSVLDRFPNFLTFNAVSSVRILPAGVDPTTYTGTPVASLTAGTDYTVVTGPYTDTTVTPNVSGTAVQVVLTQSGLNLLAANPGAQLAVDFATTIASIPASGQIVNQAWVIPGPTPTPGGTPPTPPTTPETPTNTVVSKFGRIRIYKTGVTGTTTTAALGGAVFSVYEAATTGTAPNFTYTCDRATVTAQTPITTFTTAADGSGQSDMLRLSNWYNDGVEKAVAPVVGNNDGYLDGGQYADKYGYRNYCLVETTAPTGYQLLAAPVMFSLTTEGDTTTTPITEWQGIVNQADNVGNNLPLTGGQGIALISLGGLALIGGGLGYYFVSNRRKQQA